MQNAVQSSKLPNSSKLDQEAGRQGGESDFILINVLCIYVLKISSSDKKYRQGAVMI